jgi:hypothetical protein
MFFPRYVLLSQSFNDAVKIWQTQRFSSRPLQMHAFKKPFRMLYLLRKIVKRYCTVKTVNTARARTGAIF